MCDSSKKMKNPSAKDNNGKHKQVESTGLVKSTNEDVQRTIEERLKEIPDEELQEFLDDEDFMRGLDVVDAWEGEEEKSKKEVDSRSNRDQEHKRPSRERHRRERKGSHSRERSKREERKHEEVRRDPLKSSKDIERDKMRTKRDNESKLLAEKEKAIKHLLDSDNVVPPGTETEAIQSIAERQNMEQQAQMHGRYKIRVRKSLDRSRASPARRRSPDRARLNSPRRKSPLILTPERGRSPFNERHRSSGRFSPDKRRSPRFNARRSPFLFSPERRRSPVRRSSWDRRTSPDRRWSAERHRRRANAHERRSRSRERQRSRSRSRSVERIRRKSSRSPVRRYSPRRRSRTRSRSVERRRKRSPFINELTRQFRGEVIAQHANTSGFSVDNIAPLINNVYKEAEPRPLMPQLSYIHQTGLPPPMPPSVVPPPAATPFINFENVPPAMNFDPVPMAPHPLPQTEYVSGPVMYNQGSQPGHRQPMLQASVPTSPQQHEQPSSTVVDHVQPYPATSRQSPVQSFDFAAKKESIGAGGSGYRDRGRYVADSYNGYHGSREERLKTPEPPVISDNKQFEKTSLSSLLEASVSAKDSANLPVLYPGFKPEILRHCSHALRELPMEDPRLKMKGRFFYEPRLQDVKVEQDVFASNSILLQKNTSKIHWEEEEESSATPVVKPNVQTHQKICQTDETEMSTKSVQATVAMEDFEMQVYPQDLQQAAKEEKRPIMDRLDWNVRETSDYQSKFRQVEDLRYSLNNSSQKRNWNRNASPQRRIDDRDRLGSAERGTRSMDSPIRSRDSYSGHNKESREHYRDRYSPGYRHSLDERDERDDFHDSRSEHSRGESPMILDTSAEEMELEHTFQRGGTDWHPRGKMSRGRSSPLVKPHLYRGKHSGGRPYRGRGFRGKF